MTFNLFFYSFFQIWDFRLKQYTSIFWIIMIFERKQDRLLNYEFMHKKTNP